MRYAAPPVGNLRWRAPVEPPRTNAVEQATSFGPICLGIGIQLPFNGEDEDCLFVNVWAPSGVTSQSKLPVWVFIQGGGYVSLTNANWNGAEVVEKSGHNIVMVNFNYRVGMWGFLASDRVREDGELNVGLLDQRMLLTWVKTHIASFGGDPNHVVIHGASAGAGSVAMHMVAYGGRDDKLFAGAMAESVFFPGQPFVSELEYQFERVSEQLGCDSVGSDQQMSCLRSKDTAALQVANHAQRFPGRPEPPLPLFYWTPCVDGDFLRDLPYRLFSQGSFIRVPFLAGTAANEGSVFAANAASRADVTNFFMNNYPKLSANDAEAILAQYNKTVLPALPNHAAWFPTASQAYGEATFICPNMNVLNKLLRFAFNSSSSNNRTYSSSRTRAPLFSYRFDVQDAQNTAAGLGVPHLFDAAAIFGPDNIGAGAAESYKTYNAPIVPVFMAYWISFVRALNPNRYRQAGSPVWGPWGGGQGGAEEGAEGMEGMGANTTTGSNSMSRLVVETGNIRMENTPADERQRCWFWLGMGDTLEQL
ncbi:Alpha/Beta hydrolase protein [Bombardia bombarda]|uniref:Carboxylic ester hydrolase n=1 Tax=Bombardia bombarda TaxID=252184 RepID=A0AA39U6N9_9PEZI|nr:Alpha/Beta hydrolase protein [Bombardia bombarda]